MELVKHSQPLEFKYEDIVFLVKKHANAEDKMEVALSGKRDGNDIFWTRAEYCKTIIRRMVLGWKGVTQDGKEVPYSFDALCELPHVEGRNVFLALGEFVMEHTDIRNSKAKDLKNA